MKKTIEKYSKFTTEDVREEILRIAELVGLKTHLYSMIFETGGVSYTVEKLASDIFMSSIKISEDIRMKLTFLHIGDSINGLYYSNNRIIEMEDSWKKENELERCKKLREKFISECNKKFSKG